MDGGGDDDDDGLRITAPDLAIILLAEVAAEHDEVGLCTSFTCVTPNHMRAFSVTPNHMQVVAQSHEGRQVDAQPYEGLQRELNHLRAFSMSFFELPTLESNGILCEPPGPTLRTSVCIYLCCYTLWWPRSRVRLSPRCARTAGSCLPTSRMRSLRARSARAPRAAARE